MTIYLRMNTQRKTAKVDAIFQARALTLLTKEQTLLTSPYILIRFLNVTVLDYNPASPVLDCLSLFYLLSLSAHRVLLCLCSHSMTKEQCVFRLDVRSYFRYLFQQFTVVATLVSESTCALPQTSS